MLKDYVTIIIPIYSSSKYLSRCIDSIINQSYKKIKILLLDDCSSDASFSIIKMYADTHDNIAYYRNEKNLGVSATRNIGLEKIDTEYIVFLDSDDWLDLNCIEKAYTILSENPKVDIAIWEIKTSLSNNKSFYRYLYNTNNVITGAMALSLLSHTYDNEFFISPLLGSKMFRTHLIIDNNIRFPLFNYEDDYFTFLAFINATKIALINGSCLYYYQHSSSLTHHFNNRDITDFFSVFKLIYDYTVNLNGCDFKIYFYNFLQKSLTSVINRLNSCVQKEEEVHEFKAMIHKCFSENINVYEYYKYCDNFYI